ncbi:putative LRR receptor-like serine/threonine-protein kinase [Hibiscus syriacus]|uniref:non-specific serine/threonine protein kinase n=1 Tax=Hibiscus syriacus TaxID=106335 RepID=A0A6A3D961_HIBSY|nr:probable LRR receptor-like serine/threonine-protein kinase At4g37250 [Hibiscus syriacus]KAE8735891.1 putative LRR receptor-like serine/threonine-protein kinase [Hibiscus syriacus]
MFHRRNVGFSVGEIMSSISSVKLHLWWIVVLVVVVVQGFGVNTDGVLLLSLKLFILGDPLNVLQSWKSSDQTPCSWNGVTCGRPDNDSYVYSRVTALSLPNCRLLGSIPSDLGMIQYLEILDLSNNSFNGSLPLSIFNATQLRSLDLSNNSISGFIPETIGRLRNLQSLNLSDNALTGDLPATLTNIQNLTVVSLKNNYLSGNLPTGFQSLQVLDLSSNLIYGSLPPNFGGEKVSYFNISYNRLSGEIPPQFAEKIPGNATIDLSFNNLRGEIPDSVVLKNQVSKSFSGNPHLCGEATRRACPIPSSPTSPPAIAAIPRTMDSDTPESSSGAKKQDQSRLKTGTIVGIVVGDIAGIAFVIMVFILVHKLKRKKRVETATKQEAKDNLSITSSSSESKGFSRWSCLRKRGEYEEDSDATSDTEEDQSGSKSQDNQRQQEQEHDKKGTLVTVDGEKQLELETLLKASAYLLGATGSSIMYKAVLEDGTPLAVRRIGENSVDRFRDFENQVRVIAKLVHPNLVRIRGFYCGVDEKLVINDFVPNGSLAYARYRKAASSPCHLPWESRLKIAKGVARGLAYLHEKKHVHANLKPSNILLGTDMEPKIGDFGLERLVTGDASYKAGISARNLGSKRSTVSRESFQDLVGPSPSPSPSSLGVSPYHAPESLRSLKPHPKWDVFAFGVILLELLTGKVVVVDELGQGNGIVVEDKDKALRMADAAIRGDLDGKEDALLVCFRLGYSCASPIPQKRPSMKEALQILDKIPSSTCYYGHS